MEIISLSITKEQKEFINSQSRHFRPSRLFREALEEYIKKFNEVKNEKTIK